MYSFLYVEMYLYFPLVNIGAFIRIEINEFVRQMFNRKLFAKYPDYKKTWHYQILFYLYEKSLFSFIRILLCK